MEWKRCMGCMEEYDGTGVCPHCGFYIENYKAVQHQLRPGTVLNGKYILGKVLGEGGFGISYLGWDLNLEHKVAIKEYYPVSYVTRQASQSPTITLLTGSRREFYQKGLDKFIEEARSLAKFSGLQGIVLVRDYFQENGTAYIVMEFAEGQTLKKILQNNGGSLSADYVFGMMRTVIESLGVIHNKGIIHRDISPDNMMVDAQSRVKLLDFGAARNYISEGQNSLSVILKPGYTPEEQYRSHGEQGPWTDVYALCATMYRAITGVLPPESLERVCKDNLRSPSSLGVQIRPKQEEALTKGLAVRKRDRFGSMEELHTALYQAEAEPAPDPIPTSDAAAASEPIPMSEPVPVLSKTKHTWRTLGVIISGTVILAASTIGIINREDTGKPLGKMLNARTSASSADSDKTLSKKDFSGKTKAHWEAWTAEDGVRYIGFRNEDGDAEGQGKAVYENGDEFEGYFVNGEKRGRGKYTWVNGDWYEGNFDDTMSGFGARYWSKIGETFQGEWKNGERNGLGVLYHQNGTYEVGVWKDDKIVEYLEAAPIADKTYNDIYTSNDPQLSGRAVIACEPNGIYIGEVSGQKENGWGCFYSSDGTYSEGQRKNGKVDGIFIIYPASGGCSIAYFSDARIKGPSVQIDPDGGRKEAFYNFQEGRDVVGKWIQTDGDDGEITTGVTEESGDEVIDTESETWIEGDKMYIGSRKYGDTAGDFISICMDGSHAIENAEEGFCVRYYPFYDGRSDICFIWGPTESDDWGEGALRASRAADGRIELSIYEDGDWITKR